MSTKFKKGTKVKVLNAVNRDLIGKVGICVGKFGAGFGDQQTSAGVYVESVSKDSYFPVKWDDLEKVE